VSGSDKRIVPTKYKEVPNTKWWRKGRLVYDEEVVAINERLKAGYPIDVAYKEVIGIEAKPLHIYQLMQKSGYALHWTLVQGEGVKAVHKGSKAPSIEELERIQSLLVDREISLPGVTQLMHDLFKHEEYRDWHSMVEYVRRGGWEFRQTISLPLEGV